MAQGSGSKRLEPGAQDVTIVFQTPGISGLARACQSPLETDPSYLDAGALGTTQR